MKLLQQKRFFRDPRFNTILFAIILLILVVMTGLWGFIYLEDYTLSEAFFMTIITISTVGFQEVRPLSDSGHIFTAFLIIFSFGIFAYVATTFTKFIIDGIFRNYYKDKKVKKRIKKLENHIIICGYGRNGKQAAIELATYNADVIIIEEDEKVIEQIMEESDLLYIQGNATHDEILEAAMISKASALITTFPIDADNLFVVLTAKQLNSNLKIISRASDDHSDSKLKRAGADNVIMPDKVGGQRMAKLVQQPDIVEFIEHVMLQGIDDVNLVELTCDNLATCFEGKSIRELDIRNESGANVIGIKREDNSYMINPTPDILLGKKDKIFALGSSAQLSKLKILLEREK